MTVTLNDVDGKDLKILTGYMSNGAREGILLGMYIPIYKYSNQIRFKSLFVYPGSISQDQVGPAILCNMALERPKSHKSRIHIVDLLC